MLQQPLLSPGGGNLLPHGIVGLPPDSEALLASQCMPAQCRLPKCKCLLCTTHQHAVDDVDVLLHDTCIATHWHSTASQKQSNQESTRTSASGPAAIAPAPGHGTGLLVIDVHNFQGIALPEAQHLSSDTNRASDLDGRSIGLHPAQRHVAPRLHRLSCGQKRLLTLSNLRTSNCSRLLLDYREETTAKG